MVDLKHRLILAMRFVALSLNTSICNTIIRKHIKCMFAVIYVSRQALFFEFTYCLVKIAIDV